MHGNKHLLSSSYTHYNRSKLKLKMKTVNKSCMVNRERNKFNEKLKTEN